MFVVIVTACPFWSVLTHLDRGWMPLLGEARMTVFLILPQGRLNIIDFDFYRRVAEAGNSERAIWKFSWQGREEFDPVWEMVTGREHWVFWVVRKAGNSEPGDRRVKS